MGKDILCGNAFLGLSDNKSIIKEKGKGKIEKLNFNKIACYKSSKKYLQRV